MGGCRSLFLYTMATRLKKQQIGGQAGFAQFQTLHYRKVWDMHHITKEIRLYYACPPLPFHRDSNSRLENQGVSRPFHPFYIISISFTRTKTSGLRLFVDFLPHTN